MVCGQTKHYCHPKKEIEIKTNEIKNEQKKLGLGLVQVSTLIRTTITTIYVQVLILV